MKRILTSLLTVAVLLFIVVPAGAYAKADLVLSADTVSAELKAGDKVELGIRADENAGYITGAVDVSWNSSALALKAVKYNEELAPNNSAAEIANSGSYRINFGNYLVKDNYTGKGEFFTLEFEITAAAAVGTYPIKLANAGIYDKSLKAVSTELRSGSVTLTDGGEMKLAASDAEATIGKDTEIEIPVKAVANPGYASGLADVRWDTSQLVLKDVVYNDLLAPKNNAAEITNSGSYRVNFGNYLATENYTGNGVFFTLVFEIADSATEGSTVVQLCCPEAVSKDAVKLPVTVSSGNVELVKKVETTTTRTTTTTTTSTTITTTTSTASTTTTTTTSTTSTTATSSTTASTTKETTTTSTVSSTTETSTTESASDTTTTETSTTSTTETASETSSTSSTSAETTTVSESSTSTTASTTETESTESTTTTSQTTTASTTEEPVSTTTTETTPSQPDDYDLGDVNEDGKVDAKDASMVLVAYAKVSTGSEDGLTEKQRKAADVNADGKVDAKDASSILAYYALVSTASGDIPTMKEFMAPKKA